MVELDNMDAMQRFLGECIYVSTLFDAERVQKLIDWIEATPCYVLQTDDLAQAAARIGDLLPLKNGAATQATRSRGRVTDSLRLVTSSTETEGDILSQTVYVRDSLSSAQQQWRCRRQAARTRSGQTDHAPFTPGGVQYHHRGDPRDQYDHR